MGVGVLPVEDKETVQMVVEGGRGRRDCDSLLVRFEHFCLIRI